MEHSILPVTLCFRSAQISSVELNWNCSYAVSCQCHLIKTSLKPVFLCFVFCFFYASANSDIRPGIACKVAGTTHSAVEFLAADSPVSQSRGRALKRRLCQRAVQRQFIRPEQTRAPRLLGSAASKKWEALRHAETWAVSAAPRREGGGWGGLSRQPLHCLLSRYDIAQTNFKARSGDSGLFFLTLLHSRVAHLCVRSILCWNSGG